MSRWTRRAGAVSVAAALVAGALVPVAVLGVGAAPAEAATAVTGVDVSSWQHPNGSAADINWTSVAAAGHSFAIIKATENNTYTNPYYAADVANARRAGLVVGAYHFARPKLPLTSAKDQAKYFVAATGKMRTAKTLPPVLDIEVTGGLSKANTIAWAKSFLSTVKALTGRTPMIYSYDSFLRTSLANTTSLKGYPLWYAKYSTTPPSTLPGGWNTWSVWQYTSQGSVKGLKGDIDINRFNGTKSALLAIADGTKAAPIAPGAPTNLSASLTWPDAHLTWSAPTSNGGSAITKYVVSVDGGAPGSTPTRSYVAGPLAAGTHTIKVQAVTLAATGPVASITLTIPVPQPGTTVAPPAASNITLSTTTTVSRGADHAITVTLRRADTLQTVAGQPITVKVKAVKGPNQTFELVTNANGSATAVSSQRVTSFIRATFLGSSRLTTTSAGVTVKVRPKPSANLTKYTVKHGRSVILSGAVSPLYQGETVRRQRWYSHAWHTVATRKLGATGRYSFTIKTTKKANYVYRIQLPSTKLHIIGNSRTLRLHVT